MQSTKAGGIAWAYGAEPGLRFACRLDGRGGGAELDWSGVARWRAGDGVLWIHLERDDPAAAAWLREKAGLDPVVTEALLDEETRPRVEAAGEDGLLIVLRGVCAGGPDAEAPVPEDLDLVPIHIWAEGERVITLRDKDHYLTALRDIHDSFSRAKGPARSGDLLVQIADKVVRDLEPVLDGMDEEVDRLEDRLLDGDGVKDGGVRRQLGNLRRRAVQLRRYLAPQRDALNRFQHEDLPWLTERDRARLREVADKVQRFTEYLDSIRDRAIILHEDLKALINERIARNSNRLAALGALLLPPALVAGLLGMNVGGIPGGSDPWAFFAVCALMVALSAIILWVLRRMGWF